MLPHDPTGKKGPKKLLPDQIVISEPKAETKIDQPYTISRDEKKVRVVECSKRKQYSPYSRISKACTTQLKRCRQTCISNRRRRVS